MSLVLLLTGCMTFDWTVFSADRLDAYVLDFGEVPAEQIQEVTFETTGGLTLYGAWARQDPPAPPLIFFHGNAAHIDAYSNRAEYYWLWGTHDVFLFDYRGFGRSEGEPDHDVLEEDGLAAVEYVSAETGYDPIDIPWVSLSLGSSVAVHTNDEIEAQAVILESMFASGSMVLNDSVGLDLPEGWFFEISYDNLANIGAMQSPVMLIHGQDDSFIPPDHVEDLYAEAPDNPKDLWQPAGVEHGDVIEVLPDAYQDRVQDWFLQ